MCFGRSSLKGDFSNNIGSSQYNGNLNARPTSSEKHQKKNAKMPQETYTPPSGPPPSHQEQYSAPPGPPPSHQQQQYTPPPGPPPSQQNKYAPPPPPPPSHDPAPAYHDWTSIPDTALLPPPPSMGHIQSPTSNSTLSEAERAHAWCASNPLFAPRNLTPTEIQALQHSHIPLLQPREFTGTLTPLAPGRYKATTNPTSKDSALITSLPLYSANQDSPLLTEMRKTIYFEVRILSQGPSSTSSSLSLGYLAAPYPTWRQPGWERGSLGVHSDDGRRYVNDTWGGKDFTSPFSAGETVGLGMRFSIPSSPPSYDTQGSTTTSPKLDIEISFTRNGRWEKSWDLHEERDIIEDESIEGLEGERDLYASVGIFGECEVEVCFEAGGWLFQPS